MLQELLEDRFVPNDTRMGSGGGDDGGGGGDGDPSDGGGGPPAAAGRVHVLTGPNCSGKSVYLKQAALVVFLAHVGSFVPADRAVVGLTDRIFTRLNANDSVTSAVQQSAFMRDLSQLAAMLRHATHRSLLLVDEFGKGTLAADGVGLLCAALSELAGRAPAAPRALVSTHFTEALDPALLPRHPQIEFFTMCVRGRCCGKSAAEAARFCFSFPLVSSRSACRRCCGRVGAWPLHSSLSKDERERSSD